jgi:hypothetical protein
LDFLKAKKNSRFPLFYAGLRVYLPQHCLYFLPLPHGKKFRAFGGTLEHFMALYGTFLHLRALYIT